MDLYEQAAEKIITEQEAVIGPIAVEQANKVSGLRVDRASHKVTIQDDKGKVLNKLVQQYEHLFGQTSVAVCKDAASSFISKLPAQEVPSLLR